MKIALFMSTSLQQGGGLEKYLIETAKNLSSMNVSTDVITMDDNFSMKINRLLTFYYFRKIGSKKINQESLSSIEGRLGKAKYTKCNSLKNLAKKFNGYDLIYSKNEILEAFILKFLIGYKNLPPIIFGVHTPHYYPVTESFHSKLHNFLYSSCLYNFLTSGVKCFHVSNQQSYEILSKQFSKSRVAKIYYPFNVKEFLKRKYKYRFNFKFDKDKFNIMWAARITEQKGVNDFVDIINNINGTSYKNRIIWNIFGDGDQKGKIIELKNKWENINYFGYVEHNFIANILSKNDLFISTSKWEVSPFNILEAQAMNKPVVAYNIAGPVDIIVNRKTGIIVKNKNDFSKQILKFVNKKHAFVKINKYLDKFSPKTIYKELICLFSKHLIN